VCLQKFFEFLKVEKLPKMHWNDFNGWGMVDHMLKIVLIITSTHVVQKARFISLSCDEFIIVDN